MPSLDSIVDQEIKAFLNKLPRQLPFTIIAAACRSQFGRRAWSRRQIVRYWLTYRVPKGRSSKFDRDAELRRFIDDRLGPFTVDETRTACLAKFGPARTPARATLYTYWWFVRRTLKDSTYKRDR